MLSHKLSELRNHQINHKKGSKKITDLNYIKNCQQVKKNEESEGLPYEEDCL